MASVEFGVREVLGVRPDIPGIDTLVPMVAPRPLYGEDVRLDPDWGWAGQVLVDPTDAVHVTENFRLDAKVVRWVTREEIIAVERARLTAEYGKEMMEGIADDIVLDCYRPDPDRRFVIDVEEG